MLAPPVHGVAADVAPHVRGVAADVGSTSLVEYDCVDKLSYGIHGAA